MTAREEAKEARIAELIREPLGDLRDRLYSVQDLGAKAMRRLHRAPSGCPTTPELEQASIIALRCDREADLLAAACRRHPDNDWLPG